MQSTNSHGPTSPQLPPLPLPLFQPRSPLFVPFDTTVELDGCAVGSRAFHAVDSGPPPQRLPVPPPSASAVRRLPTEQQRCSTPLAPRAVGMTPLPGSVTEADEVDQSYALLAVTPQPFRQHKSETGARVASYIVKTDNLL